MVDERLLEYFVFNESITTKELNTLEFDLKKINELIEMNFLKRKQRGVYILFDVEPLYCYGKKLITEKKQQKAWQCFARCLEITPNHPGASFQFFFEHIRNKNYDEALKYFDGVFNNDNAYYRGDTNTYLLLLFELTELPEKYKEIIPTIKLNDLEPLEDDKRYPDKNKLRDMRKDIFNRKYGQAMSNLNYIIYSREDGKQKVQDLLIKTLLVQIIKLKRQQYESLFAWLSNKEYLKMIEMFEIIREKSGLTIIENACYCILKTIIQIEGDGFFKKPEPIETKDLFEALNFENYELALELNESFNTEKGIDSNKTFITLLLRDLVLLINSFEKKEEIELEEELPKEQDKKLEPSNSFPENLISGYYNEALIILQKYLKSANKEDYMFLMVNLLKGSLIEGDADFIRPLVFLNSIIEDDFMLDTTCCLDMFFRSLSERKYNNARIYLTIISEADKFIKQDIDIKILEQVLALSENLSKRSNPEDIEIIEAIYNEMISKIEDDNVEEPTKINNCELPSIENSISLVSQSVFEMVESGVPIDEACKGFHLDIQSAMLVKLDIATIYYNNGQKDYAYQIIESVQNESRKSEPVKQKLRTLLGG
jgi:hypothetical protein